MTLTAEGRFAGRIKIIDALEVLDVDFSNMTFTTEAEVDAFYDEVDRLLEASKRRWYFLVNYTNCTIADEVWNHFGDRGKHSNVTYGLGTVRFGVSPLTRQTIRERGMQALRGVSFEVQTGEVFSIIGPNGAGKTSMLNVISGFYRPDAGRILFEGQDRTALKAYEVAELGIARTFQNVALFRGMSVLDNIMTGRLLKMK